MSESTLSGGAISRVAEMAVQAAAKTVRVDGEELSTTRLFRAPPIEHPQPPPQPHPEDVPVTLQFATLNSLVEYVEDADTEYRSGRPEFVHVESPTEVRLVSHVFGARNQRAVLASARCRRKPFGFGRFIGQQEFVIALLAQFVEPGGSDLGANQRAEVLSIIGNVVDENVRTSIDDGHTQTVKSRAGIRKAEVEISGNPYRLRPYRTFVEVAQPMSPFILRVEKGAREPQAALFEADGGAWELEATNLIKDWLSVRLKIPVYG